MNTTILAVIASIVFWLLYIVFGIPIIIFSYLIEGVREGISFFKEIMREHLGS